MRTPLVEKILRLVHAFSDHERKDQIRDLANEVEKLENTAFSFEVERDGADKVNQHLKCDLYELERRLHNAERILEDFGFRRCTAAACNCNSYHQQREEPEV